MAGLFDIPTPTPPETPAPAPPVKRLPAECLGLRGLPDDRDALDALVTRLQRCLQAAGGRTVGGNDLVRMLGVRDRRSLRLLVAYARFRRGVFQVLGWPGGGYAWGADDVGAYTAAARDAMRRARCYLALYALWQRSGTATALAQIPLSMATPDSGGDELTSLLADRSVTRRDVLLAMGAVARNHR